MAVHPQPAIAKLNQRGGSANASAPSSNSNRPLASRISGCSSAASCYKAEPEGADRPMRPLRVKTQAHCRLRGSVVVHPQPAATKLNQRGGSANASAPSSNSSPLQASRISGCSSAASYCKADPDRLVQTGRPWPPLFFVAKKRGEHQMRPGLSHSSVRFMRYKPLLPDRTSYGTRNHYRSAYLAGQ